MLPTEHLSDEAATLALGRRIARGLVAPCVIYLHGELGSGKTTLTRGILRGLGYEGKVKSPTYTLVEPYSISRLDLYHFDLYRLRAANEWIDAGFRESLDERSVLVIEWPEKARGVLPAPDLEITLDMAADGGRDASLVAHTEVGRRCLILV